MANHIEALTKGSPLRHTRIMVDLSAINANLKFLHSQLKSARPLVAIKADAYGHGALMVADECQRYGVAGLAVATLEECLQLRLAGISSTILLLEDLFNDEIDSAINAVATFTVSSLRYAQELSRSAVKRQKCIPIHVKVDSGMGRLGLEAMEALIIIEQIAALPGLYLEGVFSHFASADAENLEHCLEQIALMNRLFDSLHARGIQPRYRHIANSAALLQLAPQLTHDNISRPGIALYGMQPCEKLVATALQPALRLVSNLLKVSHYSCPTTIGYGRSWTAAAGSYIGIIPIGYADGYSRLLSNRAEVLIRARRLAVVGRVSMDMIAVDLSPLFALGEPVEVGEEVVLIGQQCYRGGDGLSHHEIISAEELAQLIGTICHEVTCGLSLRIPRLYIRDGEIIAQRTMLHGYQQYAKSSPPNLSLESMVHHDCQNDCLFER